LQQLISEQIARGGSVILTTHQEVALTRGAIQRLTLGDASGPAGSESNELETRH
jgi:ABC-type transport system involved in cytochrome c biogenesis ATPase subunit